MSNWDFEEMGEFESDAAVHRSAQRNGLDLRDVRVSSRGRDVRLEVRRSAFGDSGANQNGLHDGRRSGW